MTITLSIWLASPHQLGAAWGLTGLNILKTTWLTVSVCWLLRYRLNLKPLLSLHGGIPDGQSDQAGTFLNSVYKWGHRVALVWTGLLWLCIHIWVWSWRTAERRISFTRKNYKWYMLSVFLEGKMAWDQNVYNFMGYSLLLARQTEIWKEGD